LSRCRGVPAGLFAANRRRETKDLTDIAEFAFVAASADAFSVGTLAVSAAVGHFTFVVFETAFFALPARIALALAIDVVTASAAQDGTDTYFVKRVISDCPCYYLNDASVGE
jgi:hypothetical protein